LNIKYILAQLNELKMIIFQQNLRDKTNQWIFKHSPSNVLDCDQDKDVHSNSDEDDHVFFQNANQ